MLHKAALAILTRCVARRRGPDVIIGGASEPYMLRWWVIPRNRFFNVYLHHFLRSDDDRALHDHPWWNVSWLLKGSYKEVVFANPDLGGGDLVVKRRTAGALVARGATHAHRIALYGDGDGRPVPVWTLFVTGPNIRSWGFYCRRGWKHWKDFTGFHAQGHGHEIGPGCGEE